MFICLHHVPSFEFNMRCKLCDAGMTMMDDFIYRSRRKETCSTCTSAQAITAEIILICTQIYAPSSLSSSANAACQRLCPLIPLTSSNDSRAPQRPYPARSFSRPQIRHLWNGSRSRTKSLVLLKPTLISLSLWSTKESVIPAVIRKSLSFSL